MRRDMTSDERRLEKDIVQHTKEITPEAGPSSEAEIVRDVERPKHGGESEVLPPNPD